jgi:peptide/nickel transport system substrate-binding protein
MPAEMLKALPGYGPGVARRRAEARQIMEKLGYGPDKRLAVTVAARNVPPWRDPALILIDQLKEIYIDGELEPVDTTQWYPRLMRKDYKVGLNVTESEVDDPDAQFYENYSCGALRNYTGYCNKSVDELIDRQSQESNADKRRQLVWQIERKLIEEDARPDILYRLPGIPRCGRVIRRAYHVWGMDDAGILLSQRTGRGRAAALGATRERAGLPAGFDDREPARGDGA